MNNPFKPYIHKIFGKTRIYIPTKFVSDIKRQQKFWYCKRCYKQVSSKNTEHCNDSLMRELEIFDIEKIGLHEINEGEARWLAFQNRREMINFIEVSYGWVMCNEQFSLILIKHNP